MGSFSFPKEARIRKRKDFNRRSPKDKKLTTPHFLVIVKPNEGQGVRLGLTVGKQVGNAVRRNRIKRLLREFFRLSKKRLPPSRDIIIIALKGSDRLTYRQVAEELAPLSAETPSCLGPSRGAS